MLFQLAPSVMAETLNGKGGGPSIGNQPSAESISGDKPLAKSIPGDRPSIPGGKPSPDISSVQVVVKKVAPPSEIFHACEYGEDKAGAVGLTTIQAVGSELAEQQGSITAHGSL